MGLCKINKSSISQAVVLTAKFFFHLFQTNFNMSLMHFDMYFFHIIKLQTSCCMPRTVIRKYSMRLSTQF